jgi:2-polyprenyl-3-methyl-5-hydroxy-6-metoxy-1,4-benzoquinol methylase
MKHAGLGKIEMLRESFNMLKRRWLGWNLRRYQKGDTAAMSRLYRMRDPWGLNSPVEHFRFEETTRVIRESIGDRFGSVLEIGCGEGLQSKYLATLGDRILGIDRSLHAVNRARGQGIANATFESGDLMTYRSNEIFNLVTGCELMYYFENLESVYQRLSQLGQTTVVTYYQGAYDRLDEFFSTKSVNSETIHGVSSQWRVVWWRNRDCQVSQSCRS